jgi:hypothetical protein
VKKSVGKYLIHWRSLFRWWQWELGRWSTGTNVSFVCEIPCMWSMLAMGYVVLKQVAWDEPWPKHVGGGDKIRNMRKRRLTLVLDVEDKIEESVDEASIERGIRDGSINWMVLLWEAHGDLEIALKFWSTILGRMPSWRKAARWKQTRSKLMGLKWVRGARPKRLPALAQSRTLLSRRGGTGSTKSKHFILI